MPRVGVHALVPLRCRPGLSGCRSGDPAPDFRVVAGAAEIGAAWRRTRKGTDEPYLSVKLDDPALPQPIWGALLEATDDGPARLIWRRDRRDDG